MVQYVPLNVTNFHYNGGENLENLFYPPKTGEPQETTSPIPRAFMQ